MRNSHQCQLSERSTSTFNIVACLFFFGLWPRFQTALAGLPAPSEPVCLPAVETDGLFIPRPFTGESGTRREPRLPLLLQRIWSMFAGRV